MIYSNVSLLFMSILSIFFHPLNLKHTTVWQSLNLFSTWNFEKNAMTTTRKDHARRQVMRRLIVKWIEEKVDARSILNPTINQRRSISILINYQMALIVIEKHDQTILRQLLLCLNLSLEVSTCGIIIQLNVEEDTCQNVHHQPHCIKHKVFVHP